MKLGHLFVWWRLSFSVAAVLPHLQLRSGEKRLLHYFPFSIGEFLHFLPARMSRPVCWTAEIKVQSLSFHFFFPIYEQRRACFHFGATFGSRHRLLEWQPQLATTGWTVLSSQCCVYVCQVPPVGPSTRPNALKLIWYSQNKTGKKPFFPALHFGARFRSIEAPFQRTLKNLSFCRHIDYFSFVWNCFKRPREYVFSKNATENKFAALQAPTPTGLKKSAFWAS